MTYKSFASLYDHLMKDAPYDQWINFTLQAIENHEQEVQKIIDLGCGTGEIAVRLAKQGFQVSGVDYSQEMLAYAEQKSFTYALPVQWFQQDLRMLAGFQEIDLAISYCDVINYVTTKDDLTNVFSHVYQLLTPGGLFIFDVHNFHYMQSSLVQQTFVETEEEVSYIWECLPGDHPGDMHHELTFFSLNKNNGTYDRYDEDHHQRVYPIEVYQQVLEDVGFIHIEKYADFTWEPVMTDQQGDRIFFIAEKGLNK